MTEQSCKNCNAFARSSHAMGTCRARPPQGVPHMSLNPVSRQPEVNLLGGWPPVAEDEWCRPGPGGWQAKHEQRH